MASAYEIFDIDQNGRVSLKEFAVMSGRLGYAPPPDKNISRIAKEVDTNRNQQIDYDEFTLFFTTSLAQPAGNSDPFLYV